LFQAKLEKEKAAFCAAFCDCLLFCEEQFGKGERVDIFAVFINAHIARRDFVD
jgi:hypothetical protein